MGQAGPGGEGGVEPPLRAKFDYCETVFVMLTSLETSKLIPIKLNHITHKKGIAVFSILSMYSRYFIFIVCLGCRNTGTCFSLVPSRNTHNIHILTCLWFDWDTDRALVFFPKSLHCGGSHHSGGHRQDPHYHYFPFSFKHMQASSHWLVQTSASGLCKCVCTSCSLTNEVPDRLWEIVFVTLCGPLKRE